MKTVKLPQVAQMSFSEKLLLVEDLWDDLARHPEEMQLTNRQKAELDRRYKDYQKNPKAGSSWEEAKKRILHPA